MSILVETFTLNVYVIAKDNAQNEEIKKKFRDFIYHGLVDVSEIYQRDLSLCHHFSTQYINKENLSEAVLYKITKKDIEDMIQGLYSDVDVRLTDQDLLPRKAIH